MRRLLTSYLILKSSSMTTFIDSFFIDLYKNRRKANYKILNVFFFYSVVILMSFSMHHRFVPVHVLEKLEFCCLHALQIPKLLRLSYK